MMVTSSGTPLGFVRAEYWVERGRRVDAKMNMLQELVGEGASKQINVQWLEKGGGRNWLEVCCEDNMRIEVRG